ncbi:MAG: hypothetical protein WDO71_26545 [Bacteroidota bacterium]
MQALAEMPQQLAQQVAGFGVQSGYWGSLTGTSGPPYIGAIVCFLFIVFLFFIKGETKWWIIAASLFAIMVSWDGSSRSSVISCSIIYLFIINSGRLR